MASANSMFYWARHLVPYDVSLFWALACAYAAFAPGTRPGRSLLAGLLGFCAFVTYNGYWATVACVLTAHVALAWPDLRAALRRAAFGVLGLAGGFCALLGLAAWQGVDLWSSYAGFAVTINQGDFNQGGLVLLDYLWRSERCTALLWLGCLLGCGWLRRTGPAEDRRRAAVWAGIVLGLAAILVLGSNVFGQFVVYGRLARQVAPFCALLVGWTAARLFGPGRPRWIEALALAAVFAAGAGSMAVPLRQEFPADFYRRARRVMDDYRGRRAGTDPAAVAPEKFQFVYVGFIWPDPQAVQKPLPARYRELLRSPHPLAWRPYLYEGFDREQRGKIEATDISMRMILLQD